MLWPLHRTKYTVSALIFQFLITTQHIVQSTFCTIFHYCRYYLPVPSQTKKHEITYPTTTMLSISI